MIIPGTDGQKMSKSYDNFIDIFLSDKKLKKQIREFKQTQLIRRSENSENCNVLRFITY